MLTAPAARSGERMGTAASEDDMTRIAQLHSEVRHENSLRGQHQQVIVKNGVVCACSQMCGDDITSSPGMLTEMGNYPAND